MKKSKSAPKDAKGAAPSLLTDARIKALGDWRGDHRRLVSAKRVTHIGSSLEALAYASV